MTSQTPSTLRPLALHPLGRVESLLIAYAKRRQDQHVEKSVPGAQLATALKGVKNAHDKSLLYLPETIRGSIEAHLDERAKISLTEVWVGRLQLPARQLVLNQAAKAYGFVSRPDGIGWQNYLEELASTNRTPPEHRVAPEAALAGLLMSALSPLDAVRRCPSHCEVAMRAVERDGRVLGHADESLRGDPKVVMLAVAQNGLALRHAKESLQGDREVVGRAVERDGLALKHANESLRGDREVVMRAVKRDGLALGYANESLRGDPGVVMRAVEQDGLALGYANESLRGDREVVMRAVERNGLALEHALEPLRGDREVVTRAVEQFGWALKYASEFLRDDREMVTRAVGQDGRALKYASRSLREDREVVMQAVRRNGSTALTYASKILQGDGELRRLAGREP